MTILVWENYRTWTHSSVHEISWESEVLSHTLIVHHLTVWSTFHTWVRLILLTHSRRLLLSVLLMMLRSTLFHEMLLLWRLALSLRTSRHLLHHHRIHALHLLGSSHSHVVLLLVSLIRITSSLMLAIWTHRSLWHHLARLLLRSPWLTWLLWLLHIVHLYK